MMHHKKTVGISIPTGAGAEIGGYAGDGGKIAKMFSKYFNVLTHPNVVNGGILTGVNQNILYVEGYIFDEFFKGNLSLEVLPEYEEHKIGVIFDKSIPQEVFNVHINTIFAAREVAGLDIPYFEVTKEPAGVEFYIKNGVSTGILKNEKTLLNAGKKLLDKGCTALGVVCFFGEDANNPDYEAGAGVDPIGGVEAVISHYLSKELYIPVAHAPAFSEIEISKFISNPKVASENISSTYLPCVFFGLSRAPKIDKTRKNGLKNTDISALIIPKNGFGGAAPLSAIEHGVRVLTVDNEIKNGLGCIDICKNDIINYGSYTECLADLIKE